MRRSLMYVAGVSLILPSLGFQSPGGPVGGGTMAATPWAITDPVASSIGGGIPPELIAGVNHDISGTGETANTDCKVKLKYANNTTATSNTGTTNSDSVPTWDIGITPPAASSAGTTSGDLKLYRKLSNGTYSLEDAEAITIRTI